mgnify:CR=1 FL=1
MTNKQKAKVVNVVGFCGGGVFLALNLATNGKVPGGFIGGVLGYGMFGGLASLVVYGFMPKDQNADDSPPGKPNQVDQTCKGTVEQCRTKRERFLQRSMIFATVAFYTLAAAAAIWAGQWAGLAIAVVVLAVIGGAIALTRSLLLGIFLGYLRGNAIRVTENQYPQLNDLVTEVAGRFGMKSMPAVYVAQAGGTLNAFATRLLGRDFVILYSDLLEACTGDDEIRFLLGHELGHLALGHLRKRVWLLPSLFVPLLGGAWSRACEYSADRCGHEAAGNKTAALRGMMILAAGKGYGGKADPDRFIEQRKDESGFFMTLAHLSGTHPSLVRRAGALKEIGGQESLPRIRRSFWAYPFAIAIGNPQLPGSGLIAVGALIGALVTVPMKMTAREHAKQAVCQYHLKQIGMAISTYADENRRFPSADNIARVLEAYGLGQEALNCPITGKPYTISLSSQRDGSPIRMAHLVSGSFNMILAHESEPHGGARTVLFADNSTERIVLSAPIVWTCPSDFEEVRERSPGKCRHCGMGLMPVRPPESAIAPEVAGALEKARDLFHALFGGGETAVEAPAPREVEILQATPNDESPSRVNDINLSESRMEGRKERPSESVPDLSDWNDPYSRIAEYVIGRDELECFRVIKGYALAQTEASRFKKLEALMLHLQSIDGDSKEQKRQLRELKSEKDVERLVEELLSNPQRPEPVPPKKASRNPLENQLDILLELNQLKGKK